MGTTYSSQNNNDDSTFRIGVEKTIQIGENGMEIDVNEPFYNNVVYPDITKLIVDIENTNMISSGDTTRVLVTYDNVLEIVKKSMISLGLNEIDKLLEFSDLVRDKKDEIITTAINKTNVTEEMRLDYTNLHLNDQRIRDLFVRFKKQYKSPISLLNVVFDKNSIEMLDNTLVEKYFYPAYLNDLRLIEYKRGLFLSDLEGMVKDDFDILGLTSYKLLLNFFKDYTLETSFKVSSALIRKDISKFYNRLSTEQKRSFNNLQLADNWIKIQARDVLTRLTLHRKKLVKISNRDIRNTSDTISTYNIQLLNELVQLKTNLDNDKDYKRTRLEEYIKIFRLDTFEGRRNLKYQLERRSFGTPNRLKSFLSISKNNIWNEINFRNKSDVIKSLRSQQEKKIDTARNNERKEDDLERKRRAVFAANNKKKVIIDKDGNIKTLDDVNMILEEKNEEDSNNRQYKIDPEVLKAILEHLVTLNTEQDKLEERLKVLLHTEVKDYYKRTGEIVGLNPKETDPVLSRLDDQKQIINNILREVKRKSK